MTLTVGEFLRRFTAACFINGFPRIRYLGWLANRRRSEVRPLYRMLPAASDGALVTSSCAC
jgi:hypothetical protein